MAQAKYEKWLEKDNLILLEAWARDELTEEELPGMIDLYPDLEMNKWYDDYKTDPQYYKWQDI